MKKTSASSAARAMHLKTEMRCYWFRRLQAGAARSASLLDRVKHAHRDKPGNDGGERGSDHKKNPAGALPDLAKPGGLDEDVHQVGRAVHNVSCHSQQEQPQREIH